MSPAPGEPLVDEAHREGRNLLQKHGQHQPYDRPGKGGHTSTRFGTGRRVASVCGQAKSSLMTLPELAIFIGRPFLAVNVVSSETPTALSTLAIKSCEE